MIQLFSDSELSLDRESEAGTGSSEHEDGEREGSPRTYSWSSAPMPLPTVLLDRKIEMLLTEWNKNPDMLFTIHPVDGTFLVWHIKYLDEYNPGIFRQVQVYFIDKTICTFYIIIKGSRLHTDLTGFQNYSKIFF